MFGCFFFLSLSLVTWAVCMVCQETTVPRSLPEPPMWPLSSDSSWSLWISTGPALAPSSLIRSFSVSVFSFLGQRLQPCFYSTRIIVFLITHQQLKNLHFLIIFPFVLFTSTFSVMYQLSCSSYNFFLVVFG